jgi:hypothetical protein
MSRPTRTCLCSWRYPCQFVNLSVQWPSCILPDLKDYSLNKILKKSTMGTFNIWTFLRKNAPKKLLPKNMLWKQLLGSFVIKNSWKIQKNHKIIVECCEI